MVYGIPVSSMRRQGYVGRYGFSIVFAHEEFIPVSCVNHLRGSSPHNFIDFAISSIG